MRVNRPLKQQQLMKNKRAVLEYCQTRSPGSSRTKWLFRFKTPQGEMLIQSTKSFTCKAQAEAGFVSLIKSVAANEYTIEYVDEGTCALASPQAMIRTCRPRTHTRTAAHRRF